MQRVQAFVVVIGVVFTASQISLAVRDNNRKDLLTASEHLHDGYPSAAGWLADHGREGVRVLVQSIDATHQLEQKAWPLATRAALKQVRKHSILLTDDDRRDLDEAVLRNDAALQAALTAYFRTPTEESKNLVRDLRCVQLDLRAVIIKKPPAWQSTARSINTVFLHQPPSC